MNDPEEDIVQRNHHASPPPAYPAGKEDIMRANPVTEEPAARSRFPATAPRATRCSLAPRLSASLR
jgi:hypothetical protein